MMTHSTESLAKFKQLFDLREQRIELSEKDGYRLTHAFEPASWLDADRDLYEAKTNGRSYGGLCVFGGIRSTKSRWAVRTLIRSCIAYGSVDNRSGSFRWCMSTTIPNARMTVMAAVWEWLPESMRMMNDPAGRKRNTNVCRVRYTPSGGFADERLTFANGSVVMFIPYEADPQAYQGVELGGMVKVYKAWCTKCAASGGNPVQELGKCPGCGTELKVPIPNISAVLDEDAPERWVRTAMDRSSTRSSKVIWSFTTINGVTPAVRSIRGAAANVETRPAQPDLPADRVLVPNCPKGHVPYRQITSTPGWRAIYFHTSENCFGDNYANIAAASKNLGQPAKLAKLFGWSDDVVRRAFPLFGAHNIVEPDEIPAEGTNYRFIDPAGARNDFIVWLRLVHGMGNQQVYYLYRDWPDEMHYGEWAVPDENNPNNLNGAKGPAQNYCGYGIAEYKTNVILAAERIQAPPALLAWADAHPTGGTLPDDLQQILRQAEPDNLRRRILTQAAQAGESLLGLHEPIHQTYLDPRAAGTGDAVHKKSRTTLDAWRGAHTGPDGREIAPAFPATYAAAAMLIRDGINAINQLLYYDQSKPLVAPYNAPRLYVSRSCQQIIRALSVYVDDNREESKDFAAKSGWKDVIDPIRYLVTTRLAVIRHDGTVPVHGKLGGY
jgi:hypothetical protein